MPAPRVTLQSITGVDVQLRIAGAGSRSYAFVIDWHIRVLLAFAWLFIGALIVFGTLSLPGIEDWSNTGFSLFVLMPTAGIYLLYHPILELAMHGRTPGKRIAGVRLVTRSGDIPSAGALLVRNIFRLVDSLPFVYLVGLTSVVFTAQHVRIGDLAGGTLLVFDSSDRDAPFSSLGAADTPGMSPQAADLIQELLDRWPALGDSKAGIARSLIARVDPAASPESLAGASTLELHERLKALVSQT